MDTVDLVDLVDTARNNVKGAKMAKCGKKTEVYSRVCGYFRPVANWNQGKKAEFKERKTYKVKGA